MDNQAFAQTAFIARRGDPAGGLEALGPRDLPPRGDPARYAHTHTGPSLHPYNCIRLPRSRRVVLRLEPGASFDLWFAHRRFRVELEPEFLGIPAVLSGLGGMSLPLVRGRNLVGRGTHNDVVLDADPRNLSRCHAIVEIGAGGRVAITDVSSRGTFVPRRLVDPATLT